MKIFRTKVFKILDCLIHGRGMLRVNWDREYGPSDIYINKCTLNRVGESLNDDWNFTYSMVFITYLKNNVAAQRISPWTHTLLSNVRFQQVQTVTYMYIYLPRSIFTYIVYHIIYDMHQSAISLNSSRINPKTQHCANANGILQETYSLQCTIKPKVRDKLEQNICTAVLCFWEKRLWHEGWMYCI